jgi:hypothetical protein
MRDGAVLWISSGSTSSRHVEKTGNALCKRENNVSHIMFMKFDNVHTEKRASEFIRRDCFAIPVEHFCFFAFPKVRRQEVTVTERKETELSEFLEWPPWEIGAVHPAPVSVQP